MPVSPDYPMPWARGTQISLRVYRALQGGTPRTEALRDPPPGITMSCRPWHRHLSLHPSHHMPFSPCFHSIFFIFLLITVWPPLHLGPLSGPTPFVPASQVMWPRSSPRASEHTQDPVQAQGQLASFCSSPVSSQISLLSPLLH